MAQLKNIDFQESTLTTELYLEGSIARLTADIRFKYNDRTFSLQDLIYARKEVMDAYQADGFNKSCMKILTVILRLRLSVSAKLNLLKEIVQEAVNGGHKVLIFSQFIGMLTIIGEYLKKEKIVYEYMDGSTQDRAGCVERFNTTQDIKVFLLSLKVGDVGLNLTSADTVIIYEPWWNPAHVEL